MACAKIRPSPVAQRLHRRRCRSVEDFSIAPGPPPGKSEAALRVVTPLAGRTCSRPAQLDVDPPPSRRDRSAREGVRISRSQLSKALRKKVSAGGGPGTPAEGTRQTESEVEQVGLRACNCQQIGQAELSGDIALRSTAYESEALTHPISPTPGRSRGRTCGCRRRGSDQIGRNAGVARSRHAPTHRPYQPDQAQQRFHRPSGATRPSLWTAARATGQSRRSCWSRTMVRSTPANARSPPWPPAHIGSPSSGCRNTPPNSMKSSRSGAILRPITSHPPDLHRRRRPRPSHSVTPSLDLNRERIPDPLAMP